MNSRKPGPADFNPLLQVLNCKTPGPLGQNDYGDPFFWLKKAACSLLGDTPGPLGVNDHADPVPGLAGARSADTLALPQFGAQADSAGPASAADNLSGADWWNANQAKYPNSVDVDQLATPFQGKVKDFLAALDDAGANVSISTTRRSKQRAYLMHYCWMIANGQIDAKSVPAEPGVDIKWNHGDAAESKKAAQEMVDLFKMAQIAVLNSNHIQGLAIDMTIKWDGTLDIKNKAGDTVSIAAPRNGADNTKLHAVGATYGVIKLVSDRPHWSVDGH